MLALTFSPAIHETCCNSEIAQTLKKSKRMRTELLGDHLISSEPHQLSRCTDADPGLSVGSPLWSNF